MPKYIHDCDECKYIGSLFEKIDVYHHITDLSPVIHKVLFRYGNECHEYDFTHISHAELMEKMEWIPKSYGEVKRTNFALMEIGFNKTSLLINNFQTSE